MNLIRAFGRVAGRERLVRWSAIGISVGAISAACLGQSYYYPAPAGPVGVALLGESQIDQLTASIALYPDPLLAELLPAATYPLDVVSAGQWVRNNPGAPPEAIDQQGWDPSVRALAHYPSVLQMLADNIDWTQQLGEAYVNQPADVMNSIQRLRGEAQAAGSLVNSPQQVVIVDQGAISIIPAEPEVIYVPQYDPTIVYVRRSEPWHDAIRFSTGFRIGVWLDKDTDWHDHWISEGAHWEGDRGRRPDQRVEVRRPEVRGKEWTRDQGKPLVVHVDRPGNDEHRGYAPPHAQPAAPPRGFGEYKGRGDVEHEEDRGRQSLHQPAPQRGPVKEPVARQEPKAPARAPEAPHQQQPPPQQQQRQQPQQPPQQHPQQPAQSNDRSGDRGGGGRR